MVLFKFGDFDWACRNVPSLPVCNLFFRQLLVHPKGLSAPATSLLGLPNASSSNFTSLLTSFASGSVNPSCSIPRMTAISHIPTSLVPHSYGNLANIIACAISVLLGLSLAILAGRRAAAVGRVEMRVLFLVYALVQAAQLVDTGGILRAGSTALSWVTAVHLGLVVGFFWVLLWVAFLSLQVVEDGTIPSVVPMSLLFLVLFIGSTYIFLDTALTITTHFQSSPPNSLHSIWLFVLTIIWPAASAFVYFVVQLGVVVRVLKEKKPLALFSASAILFILSQADYFALSHTICSGSNQKVDGSFVATILESASVGILFLAWQSITEDSWDGVAYLDEN